MKDRDAEVYVTFVDLLQLILLLPGFLQFFSFVVVTMTKHNMNLVISAYVEQGELFTRRTFNFVARRWIYTRRVNELTLQTHKRMCCCLLCRCSPDVRKSLNC